MNPDARSLAAIGQIVVATDSATHRGAVARGCRHPVIAVTIDTESQPSEALLVLGQVETMNAAFVREMRPW
jgi:hypothetical protein